MVTALLLIAGAAAAAVLLAQLTGSRSATTAAVATPAFLTEALGVPQSNARLVREPAPSVRLAADANGFRYERAGESVALSADLGGGRWSRFAGGADRRTPFGRETIVFRGENGLEQFLTVHRRQGKRTWSWTLDAGKLEPTVERDGSVRLATATHSPGLVIAPVAILDAAGKDVTPEGVRWSVTASEGAWRLELALDDRNLPLPYVIDPNITQTGASSASSTGSPVAPTRPGNVGDLLVAHVSVRSTGAITAPAGWNLIDNRTQASTIQQAVYWKFATGSESTSFSWAGGGMGAAGIIAYANAHPTSSLVSTPVDAWSENSGSGTTATATGVSTNFPDEYLAALYSATSQTTLTQSGSQGLTQAYADGTTGGGPPGNRITIMGADGAQASAGASGNKTATVGANVDWLAHLVAIRKAPDDGDGTLTTSATNVAASSTGHTISFTYTAGVQGTANGAVTIVVPTGWSAPSTSSNPGYTTASAGTVSVSGQTITVSGLDLAAGATVTITYGSTAGGGPGATASSTTGAQTWQAQQRGTAAGTLTNLGSSPSITVNAADGSGTLSASPPNVAASSTGNTVTLTYAAATGGMSDGAVIVEVPSGWPAPAGGNTSTSSGSLSFSGQTITVSGVTLAGGATLDVTYGTGGGVTAPSSTGAQTWQAQQRSVSGSALTSLGSSPSITVNAANGSGTADVAPSETLASSTGNTLTFTYTTAVGGMSDGELTIDVPAGWSAPSTTGTDAGYTTASVGTVSVSGQRITVSEVTRAGGQTGTIVYGSTAGGGSGATATSTRGAQTWQVKQKGTSGGPLTDLASSPSIFVANNAPTATVSLAPASPKTDDTLTASATTGDVDGDTVTVSYVWKRNGVAIAGETGDTLDLSIAGNGDKGDLITVEVTPNDGAEDGTTVSDSETVGNTAPTATVSLAPASPKTNDTLTATVTTGDADGDTVTVTRVWKKNGIVIAGQTGTTLDLSLHADKGDLITIEVTPNDGDTDGTTASDDVTVANTAPTVSIVTIDQTAPKTNDTLTVSITSSDADGDAHSYTYQWAKNGIDIFAETAATLDLSVLGNGDKGDEITVRVTADDGEDTSTPVTSPAVTVVNSAPVLTSVTIDQAAPKTNDDLTATVSAVDADGDTITVSRQWRKNGADLAGETGATLDLSIAGNGDKGDSIALRVSVSDGTDSDGPLTSAGVVVQNTAPTATVSLSPAGPGTDDTVTASVTTGDADGDPVTVTYVWKRDGIVIAGETGSTLDLSVHGDKGDLITVEVTPNDGAEDGTTVSDSETVGNTAPTATVSLAPASPKTNDTLTATVTTGDADGDTVTVSYVWKRNGIVIAGETGTTLDLSVAGNGDKDDVITVEATPNDGDTDGAAASEDVTVADSAPTATVSLAPASPKTDDTLTASVTTDDPDGEPVTVTRVWKRNSVVIADETGTTLDLSLHGDKGDLIAIEVTPTGGDTVTDEVTVVNSAPVLTSVTIDQAAPKTDDTLTATVVISDADGDTLTVTRQWRKNGADLAGETGATLDLSIAGNGDKGDAIALRVSVTDGTDSDGPLTSSAATIVNTPPECTDTALFTFRDQPGDTAPVCTDADAADTLTFAIVSQGSIGTASVAGGLLHYEPDPGLTGPDAFTYEANDGTASSAAATVAVTVDDPSPAAPDVPALVSPADAAFTSDVPTLTATFSDPNPADTGTIEFEVCADATCTAVVSTFSSSSGIANGADGSAAVPGALDDATTYHWRARATDDTGRTSGWSATRTFTVDVSGPTPSVSFPAASGDYRAGTWSTPEGAAADGGSGVQLVEVAFRRLSDGFWWDATISSWVSSMTELFDPAAGTGSWSYAFPVAEFDTDGLYELHARATDFLGNQATTVVGFRIDREAPTTGDDAPAGYRNGPVTVTLSASDTGSGVQVTTYELDGGPTQSGPTVSVPGVEGTYTITYRSTDAAGNVEADRTATVRIDTTAPTTTDDAPAGYRNGPVTVTLTPADSGGSGVQTTTYEVDGGATETGTSVPIPGVEGTYTITYRSIDAAGNVEADRTATVRIDTTAPTTTDDAPAGWQSGAVTVTLTPADSGGSGVQTTTYELDGGATTAGTTVSVPAASGTHTITYRSADTAGNVEADGVATVDVDVTAPSISVTYPTGGTLVGGVVTITTTPPSDAHSGVSSVAYAYSTAGEDDWQPTSSAWDTTALDDGFYDVRAVVSDNAGNTAESVVAGVQVDNNPPDLAFTAPAAGAYVNAASPDPLTLSADASDAGTGVQDVEFFECTTTAAACAGGSWSSVGLDTTGSPYTTAWTLPADGNRALRAVATDNVGQVSEEIVEVTVDRTPPTATMDDPGDHLRATIGLTATANDTTSGVGTVAFQYSAAGAGDWQAISSDATAPYEASFDTTSVADGLYDFRVFVTDAAGNAATAAVGSRLVDNTKPTAAIDDPGDHLGATVTLTATAADSGSGVATVEFQRSPAGAASWTAVATDSDGGDGWSADLVTTGLADGLYDFRAVVTDRAGNSETSSIGDRLVDNTKPAAGIADPGEFLRGTVALSGSAADAGSGVATVEFQRSPAGAGTWTQIGVDSDGSDGWSGSFVTTSVSDGLYDLRVVVTDRAGNSETAAVASRLVDNTKPAAAIDDPGAFLRDVVTLTGSASDAGSGVSSVAFERSAAGSGGPWTAIGTDTDGGDGWSAGFDTTAVSDGLYDVRALVTDRAGNTETATIATRRVDNTPPSTGHDAPGGPSSTDVTVTLTPGDSGSGVAATAYRVDDGPWQSGTSVLIPAPGDHSNDGSHAIEFYSTDAAGNVEGVQSATVVIDTTGATGTPADPGSFLRGVVTLESTADDESGVVSGEFEFSPAGMDAWASIGTDFSAPFSVTWDTTIVADGDYDLRVRIVDGAGNESLVDLPGLPKVVDNTSPTGSVTAPAEDAFVSGTVTVSASASDTPVSTAIASVTFEVKPAGAGEFSSLGADTTAPYGVSWDTTGMPDGPAELRVVVADLAGNASYTSAVRTVTVDNDAPTVTFTHPTNDISGTTTLNASGSADIVSMTFERSPADAGSWTAIGTDTTSPFQASFDTTLVADGLYDVRVVATDGSGNTGTSQVLQMRVDNTPPSGSMSQPTDGATVGGPSIPLAASTSDAGSGVESVGFQFRPAGGGAFTDIAGSTWDSTGEPSGEYELRAVVRDKAGNEAATAAITVTVDSTAPTVSLADPGATLQGVVSLSATVSGGGAVRVVFEIAPAGSGAWSELAEDTTSPYAASLDTEAYADGLYDLRAVVYDQYDNVRDDVRAGVLIDNTPPSVASASPADGSVVASVATISVTASEPLSAVDSPTLDGSPVAGTLAGDTFSVDGSALGTGPHVLRGTLVDVAGRTRAFRLHFTIPAGGGNVPYVEKNAPATALTSLTAVDGSATVTMPAGAWQQTGADWLVLRVAPVPAGSITGPTTLLSSAVVDVTARWALAGTEQHEFDAPLDILIANTSGSVVIPATLEGSSWRMLRPVPGSGLPAGWQDGFYRDGAGVHVVTRHLSVFALLLDVEPPESPGFGAEVADDGLTLRWYPGRDNSGVVQKIALLVNGVQYQLFDPTQYEVKMGPITADDTRTFAFSQQDGAGNWGTPSPSMRALPPLAGRTLPEAESALAERGFSIGRVREAASGEPAGTVLEPSGVTVLLVGSAIDLVVSAGAGPTGEARLVFSVVGTKKFSWKTGMAVAVRVTTMRAAHVNVALMSPRGRRVHTWRFHVKAGRTIKRLRMPRQVTHAGTYRLVITAASGTQAVRRTIPVQVVAAVPTAKAKPAPKAKPAEIVLAGKPKLRKPVARGLNAPASRVIPATGDDEAFTATGNPRRNVELVVVDVDRFGVALVRDLRRVFPSVKVIALASKPALRVRAVKAGAAVALPRSTPAPALARVIRRLSGR